MKENYQAYQKIERVGKRIVGKKKTIVIELTEEATKRLPEVINNSSWGLALHQELRERLNYGEKGDYLGFGTDCAWRGGIGKDE